MKFLIKLRKKLILPVKWNRTRDNYIRKVELKKIEKILSAKELMEKDLIVAKRLGKHNDIEILERQIELLNWVLNV